MTSRQRPVLTADQFFDWLHAQSDKLQAMALLVIQHNTDKGLPAFVGAHLVYWTVLDQKAGLPFDETMLKTMADKLPEFLLLNAPETSVKH